MNLRDAPTAFRDASLVWKGTFCLQVAALIVCLVGFGTNYLVYYAYSLSTCNGGLWEIYCDDAHQWETDDFLKLLNHSTEWLDASKGIMSISVGIHILCIVFTLGTAFINANKLVLWGVASAEFASALSGLIGCSVATAKLKSFLDERVLIGAFSVSSSFILFLVAQFAFVGAGLLLLLDSRLKMTSRPSNPAPALKIAAIF